MTVIWWLNLGPVLAQEPPPLAEIDQLRLQVNALKAQLLQLQLDLTQCQAQAVSGQLQQERSELEKRLGPIDWQTLKPKPATPSGGATPPPQVPKAPGSPSGGSSPPGGCS